MSWSVNDIYQAFLKLSNKNQSGNITATRFFYVWNTEQAALHNDLIGRWQARANGKQGANTGLIRNESILIDLAPFTINTTLAIASGNVAKPAGFIYTNDLRFNGNRITHITNAQRDAVAKSVIDPPSLTTETYYYTEYENNYYILPQTLTGNIELDYVAEATDIVWGFTLDADDRQVYDINTSVQPLWNQDTIVTITKRAFVNLGIMFDDNNFTNFGRAAQSTGS